MARRHVPARHLILGAPLAFVAMPAAMTPTAVSQLLVTIHSTSTSSRQNCVRLRR
jgi:hypothetical protein